MKQGLLSDTLINILNKNRAASNPGDVVGAPIGHVCAGRSRPGSCQMALASPLRPDNREAATDPVGPGFNRRCGPYIRSPARKVIQRRKPLALELQAKLARHVFSPGSEFTVWV